MRRRCRQKKTKQKRPSENFESTKAEKFSNEKKAKGINVKLHLLLLFFRTKCCCCWVTNFERNKNWESYKIDRRDQGKVFMFLRKKSNTIKSINIGTCQHYTMPCYRCKNCCRRQRRRQADDEWYVCRNLKNKINVDFFLEKRIRTRSTVPTLLSHLCSNTNTAAFAHRLAVF